MNCLFLILEFEIFYEKILLIFYSIEVILKIFAKGFILNKDSYLRNNWNKFDFIIIVSSISSLVSNYQVNFGGIRIFRILRPLRTISSIENLRVLLGPFFKRIKI